MADADVAFHEDKGFSQPAPATAVPVEGAHSEHPEREVKPETPNLPGEAAPLGPKKGMVDKVKDLFGGLMKGHHNNNTGSAVGSGIGHSPDSSSPAADNQEFEGPALDPTAASPAGNTFRQQGARSPGPWPHPTNPRHTQAQGGAATTPTGEHSNLHPGPQNDGVKKEGFLSMIKDKLQSPRSPYSPKSSQ